jgi:hypothetical protein
MLVDQLRQLLKDVKDAPLLIHEPHGQAAAGEVAKGPIPRGRLKGRAMVIII